MLVEKLQKQAAYIKNALEDQPSTTFSDIVLLAVLLVGFNGLWRMRRLIYIHPEWVYQNKSIIVSSLHYPTYLAIVLIPSLFLVVGRQGITWDRFKFGRELRWVVVIATFPVIWSLITADYNHYFGQAYHIDRILLLVAYALLWLHPGFVFVLATFIFTFEGQLLQPFGHMSTTNTELPKQILLLFVSYLFLQLRNVQPVKKHLHRTRLRRLYTETPDESVLIWAVLAVVGASYFNPAINKLTMLWPFRENVAYYIVFSYGRGWLASVDPAIITQGYNIFAGLNPLLVWGTIVIELAGIALVWSRRGFYWIIGALIGLHLVIFAMTGIFFKMWIIVLVSVAWFMYRVDARGELSLFNGRTVMVVTGLVLISSLILPITPLAWYQTNYDYTYTVEVVGEDGDVYDVGWQEMGPYELTFQQNRLSYIDNSSTLEARRSVKEYPPLQRIRGVERPAEIHDLRSKHGTVSYDREQAEQFDRFVQQYFSSKLCNGERDIAWTHIPYAPHKYWISPNDELPDDGSYTEVRIRRTAQFYDNGAIEDVDSEIVRTVPLKESRC